MLLEDRFYLMPVLPDSYEFSKAQIDSLGTMILEYTDANNNYFGVSLSLNKDKVSYKTTETFVKLDGKEVQMAIYLPESGNWRLFLGGGDVSVLCQFFKREHVDEANIRK